MCSYSNTVFVFSPTFVGPPLAVVSKAGSLIVLALDSFLKVVWGVHSGVFLQPACPHGQLQVEGTTAGVAQTALLAVVERVTVVDRLDVATADVALRVLQERRLQVSRRTGWGREVIK